MFHLPVTGEPDSFHNFIFLIKTRYLSDNLSDEFFMGTLQSPIDALRLEVHFSPSLFYCSQSRLKLEKSCDHFQTSFFQSVRTPMISCFKD